MFEHFLKIFNNHFFSIFSKIAPRIEQSLKIMEEFL